MMFQMRGMLVLVLVALACLHVSHADSATEWTPSSFPNPLVDVDRCGRGGKKSWICDPDGLIDVNTADHIEGVMKKIVAGAEPYVAKPCGTAGWEGFQTAVAVMNSFHVPPGVDPGEQAELMAKALHDKWGVGNAACHNGVLLLLAIHNRQTYLSTGKGAKKYLSNSQARTIVENMKPLLRKAKYGEALDEAVVNIGLALAGRHIKPESQDGGWASFAVFSVVAGIIGWVSWAGWRNHRRYKRCKDRLEQIKKDQQAIRERRYVASTCPVCLDTFESDDKAAAAGEDGSSEVGAAAAARDPAPSAPPLHSVDETSPLLSTQAGASGSGSGSGSGADPSYDGDKDKKGSKTFVNPLKQAKQAPAKKPLYLRCGHAFCEPCIAEWMKTKSSCPVCRKDVDNDDPPQAHRPPPPPRCSDQHYYDLYGSELQFRMQRMHFYYPDYVTYNMLNSWEDDLRNQRDLNTDMMRQFELNNPANRDATTQSGSSGASTSWGGGSSSGGGGYGSSW